MEYVNKKVCHGMMVQKNGVIKAWDITPAFDDSYDSKKGIYELSGLCRFIFSGNETEGDKVKRVKANLPIKNMLSLWKRTDSIYSKVTFDGWNNGGKEYYLLKTEDKYMRNADNGLYPIYNIAVKYNPAMNYPIIIEVKNYKAPVNFMSNGQTQIEKSKADPNSKTFVQFMLTLDEWVENTEVMKYLWKRYLTVKDIASDTFTDMIK